MKTAERPSSSPSCSILMRASTDTVSCHHHCVSTSVAVLPALIKLCETPLSVAHVPEILVTPPAVARQVIRPPKPDSKWLGAELRRSTHASIRIVTWLSRMALVILPTGITVMVQMVATVGDNGAESLFPWNGSDDRHRFRDRYACFFDMITSERDREERMPERFVLKCLLCAQGQVRSGHHTLHHRVCHDPSLCNGPQEGQKARHPHRDGCRLGVYPGCAVYTMYKSTRVCHPPNRSTRFCSGPGA